MNEAKNAQQARIEELFGTFPDSIDWADDLARETVSNALDLDGSFGLSDSGRWTKEQSLAWSLAVSLAIEIRHLRHQAKEAKEIFVEGEVDSARKKLREQFASPDFIAEFVRDAAGILDSRGMSPEANALRDTATILDTEF